MKENTFNFFSFENNPILGTARKAGETVRDLFEGVAREQIAGATEFVDLSSKQFDAITESENIEDVIKVNREWFSGSTEIVKEHTSNTINIIQDAAGTFISSEKSPVKDVMKIAEETVANTTKIVEEAAA